MRLYNSKFYWKAKIVCAATSHHVIIIAVEKKYFLMNNIFFNVAFSYRNSFARTRQPQTSSSGPVPNSSIACRWMSPSPVALVQTNSFAGFATARTCLSAFRCCSLEEKNGIRSFIVFLTLSVDVTKTENIILKRTSKLVITSCVPMNCMHPVSECCLIRWG